MPVLAEAYNFQTIIGGSLNPSVTLVPVNPRFDFATASIPVAVSRRDTHKLIVAMSLPPTKPPEEAHEHAGGGLVSLSATHANSGRTASEERASSEIDNQKTINSLNNISLR